MELYSVLSVLFFGITLAYGDQDVVVTRKELIAEIEPLKQQLQSQREELQKQDAKLQNQEDFIQRQNGLITEMSATIAQLTKDTAKSSNVREYYTAMGCLSEDITLSCENDGMIDLENGIYGVFRGSCEDTCCPPYPDNDCEVDVEENSPSEWLNLVTLCQNQTSCEFEYEGVIVNDCGAATIADYMQIFYSCLSETSNQPVGFTAYGIGSSVEYTGGNIVLFDRVIDNIGGSYNVKTASFLCPVNGVYVFSITLLSALSERITIEIWMDDVQLVEGYTDDADGVYHSGSNLVVSQCNARQRVWARVGLTGVLQNTDRRSTFSGFLLNRL